MFEDNQKKLYIIVNRNLDASLLMNATGHLAAGIMQKAEDGVFQNYSNDSSGLRAYLSHYTVVILQAKNSNQLSTAAQKCRDAGLTYNFFTTTFASPDALEFVAIAIYGDTEILKPITKKFSVYN
jgi:hypothetical protein